MVEAASVLPARPRGRVKSSRLWWLVHQWVGLKLSIFLSFVLLTGTLAVFSTEIDWVLRPAMRVDPASVSGPVDWAAVAQAVAADRPGEAINRLDAPTGRAFAATATVRGPDGSLAFVYAHPTTGAVQGDGHWVGAKRIFRNMHRHLMMPVDIGVPIVSSLALLLLLSLVSALVVYKKWWRGFFRPVRLAHARTALGDVHRLAGLWSLWFTALMIVTGIWYLAESVGLNAPPQPRAQVSPAVMTTPELAERLDESLAAARRAYPDLRIVSVLFPNDRSGAFVFHGDDRAILVRPRSNTVWTSAATAEVVLTTDGRDLNLHQRIGEMADPLHFGTFGGLWTKVIWFAFGLLMTGMSVSGIAIYGSRVARAPRRTWSLRATLAQAWTGMGWWRWVGLGLVLASFALLPSVFAVGGD